MLGAIRFLHLHVEKADQAAFRRQPEGEIGSCFPLVFPLIFMGHREEFDSPILRRAVRTDRFSFTRSPPVSSVRGSPKVLSPS